MREEKCDKIVKIKLFLREVEQIGILQDFIAD